MSGRTTWERPAFDFEEDGAARRLVRAYRAYVERRELARDLGSDHLPALIADVREAACLVCPWWPRGDPLRDADASPPLELWLARRGFSRDAVARAARVAARRARRETDATRHLARTDAERARADRAALREARAEVLAAIRAVEAASRARDAALAEAKQAHDWRRRRGEPVGDDLEAATKAHADETAAEDAQLERLGLRDAADRRWLRRYDDARAKPLAYWTSARDDRPLADALRAQGPAAYGAPLLAAYRNQKNRCAAMAAALAASRFPVTGCMVDRLLADFPSKPAAAQDAVAARLVDVPTTAVAADERAALAALAAGARRVRDLVAESGATELAERLDATYRAACAVEQPLDDAAATGSAGATVLALRRQALAEADAAAAAARGGEASGAAARACWLIDDGVLELALRAWRATTRLQTGARRASALRQHARRKAARAAAGALVRRGWRCVVARRLATLMRAQQRAPWHMLHDDASGAFYFQHVESGEVSWEAPEGGEAAYRPQVVDRFSGRWVLAWPQLERPKPLALQQPREGYCMACKLEPATRRCDTCAAPRFELVPPSWGDGHFHFCFACFYTHHDRSPAMKAHKAVLTRALTAPPLTCCVCAEPATRRCRGLVLPPRGRFILQRFLLQHAVAGDAVRVDDDDDDAGGGADDADAEAAAAPGESEAARGERRRAREKREFDADGAAARAALARENEELAAEAGKPAPEAADPRTLTAAKLRTALRGAGVPLSLARARAARARGRGHGPAAAARPRRRRRRGRRGRGRAAAPRRVPRRARRRARRGRGQVRRRLLRGLLGRDARARRARAPRLDGLRRERLRLRALRGRRRAAPLRRVRRRPVRRLLAPDPRARQARASHRRRAARAPLGLPAQRAERLALPGVRLRGRRPRARLHALRRAALRELPPLRPRRRLRQARRRARRLHGPRPRPPDQVRRLRPPARDPLRAVRRGLLPLDGPAALLPPAPRQGQARRPRVRALHAPRGP